MDNEATPRTAHHAMPGDHLPSQAATECACPPIGDSSDCPVHGEA